MVTRRSRRGDQASPGEIINTRLARGTGLAEGTRLTESSPNSLHATHARLRGGFRRPRSGRAPGRGPPPGPAGPRDNRTVFPAQPAPGAAGDLCEGHSSTAAGTGLWLGPCSLRAAQRRSKPGRACHEEPLPRSPGSPCPARAMRMQREWPCSPGQRQPRARSHRSELGASPRGPCSTRPAHGDSRGGTGCPLPGVPGGLLMTSSQWPLWAAPGADISS